MFQKHKATGARAFRSDRRDGGRLDAGCASVEASANLLGANHNYGDHAVISWRNTRSVLATLYWNSSWSSAWRVGGKSFRDVYARIRRQRFPVGTILRRTANGSKRVSVRGRYAGNRFARSASGACVASCLSSIRRSIDRNRSGAGDDRGLAREGRRNKQSTGQKYS